MAEQKTKEIGIRKVLGASIANILGILYREFVFLIIIAYVIAIQLAVWQLSNRIEAIFVYHISISVVSVVLAGLAALVISMLTISFHTVKAGLGNPVDAIKYE